MQNKILSEWLYYIEKNSIHINHPNLDHLKIIAKRLNIFPVCNPVITVTGTNGKGSCVTLLTQILQNSGYKIGKYTSPHLLDYLERIICNNQTITDTELCDAFARIEKNRMDITLNYFEWTTLAAFIIFKQHQLDAWILEVGVGGRLDPVNIIDSDLSIITTVAIDHVHWLGNSREQIGYEKAGIMRTQKPVICGDFDTPDSIKNYAQKINAQLFCQSEHFGFTANKQSWSWWSKNNALNNLPKPQIEYQNAATVIAALEHLTSYFTVNEQVIHMALQNTFLLGRYQKIPGQITHILDVAHNPAAAQLLANKLMKEECHGRMVAVLAMLNDKDHVGTISPLIPIIKEWYLADLNVTRGSHASQLVETVQQLGGNITMAFDSVIDAYNAALCSAHPNDYVIIFGSFYAVAEVLKNKYLLNDK